MNIKNLIKNQSIRRKILRMFFWLPDKVMLSIQYKLVLHRNLNWKNPQRFTEKIQIYKTFYRNKLMLECTDKYKVRQYVEKKLGTSKYLNQLYQVCEKAEQIKFHLLPNQFVIKTTDGGNGDNIFICRDKLNLDIPQCISKINSWKYKKYESYSREWAYKGAQDSKIIVEKLLISPENKDGSIDDFKFLCFNKKFKYLWIDKNRYSNHQRGFWDEKLNFLPNIQSDHPTFNNPPILPNNIHEMIQIAEKLSEDFPFARIDLYNINGNIVFGEITFYPWSGYVQFNPDSFDFELGKLFDINFQ